MSKKHWILIKRGLSQDPKHREQMGNAIWVYMHILDRADWETGIVYDWKDNDEADDMSLNVRTMRKWRRELAEAGYITCIQEQYGQKIIIHNWVNPRTYSGEVLNEIQGDTESVPQKEAQGDTQGYMQGDTQGSINRVTPTYTSLTSNQESVKSAKAKPKRPKANTVPELVLFRAVTERYPPGVLHEVVKGLVHDVGERLGREPTKDDLSAFYLEWTGRGYNPQSIKWLEEWAVSGVIPQNGKKPLTQPRGVTVAQSWLQKRQGANG